MSDFSVAEIKSHTEQIKACNSLAECGASTSLLGSFDETLNYLLQLLLHLGVFQQVEARDGGLEGVGTHSEGIFHEVNHQVVQDDQLVLLVVQLPVVKQHLVEGGGANEQIESEVTSLLVDIDNFLLRLTASVIVRA